MHHIKETTIDKADAEHIFINKFFEMEMMLEKKRLLKVAMRSAKQHDNQKFYDEQKETRKDQLGYEYSMRGFKSDLENQHEDIMSDELYNLDDLDEL